jgi:heavy metal sensor kinase
VHRLPIRWRLTGWYASLMAVALIIFGGGVYIALRIVLYQNLEMTVRDQTDLALSTVQIGADGQQLSVDPAAMADFRGSQHFIRLIGMDRHVISDTSPTLGGVPIDDGQVSNALSGDSGLETVKSQHDTFVVATAPIHDASRRIVGVLQTGASRSGVDEDLRHLLLALTIAAPLVLIAAAGGGYILAGRALAPVAEITKMAAGISAADLHARIDLPLPDDELGRLASTFNAMLSRIEDAFERQRRFTGDAAHELRTPLSLMRSQVDLSLARPRDAADYREALEGIDADLGRLTGLIGTLLTLARSDTGRLAIEHVAIDLADTIAVILEQYTTIASEAGIRLCDESSCAPLIGDDDLLVQVLVNLLDNAIAHTPAGGEITVGSRTETGAVRFWVHDQGCGIPEEHLPRIFDRFYRVDESRQRSRGGAGLGLSICRAIIDAHGGRIEVVSKEGGGTKVDVILPSAPLPRVARRSSE